MFQGLALKYPPGSVKENLFHLLGEVEVVFGLWAGILIAALMASQGTASAIGYVESLNFTEPVFVFVIMAISSTRPVLWAVGAAVRMASRALPFTEARSFYLAALVLGPILGSFITEPAAMTVTALVLKDRFFSARVSDRFKYATLALLFVNVSIGGVLTAYAAPPVLMVAGKWGWTSGFMFANYGWKATLAVLLNAALAAGVFWRELGELETAKPDASFARPPFWLLVIHFAFLSLVVVSSHHPIFFLGAFLFFLGVVEVTGEYQDKLRLKESLLVGFFLGGLVVLGAFQAWWLKPVLLGWGPGALFLGGTILTAFVDNAALTYLGSQVEGISLAQQYALVAGAVAGGGLTVIANAPNPAGYSLLRSSFGATGINPLQLFFAALPWTVIAMGCFWLLP